jgi:iduronate 2-sulfatase
MNFLPCIILGFLLTLAVTCQAENSGRPNVLFIAIDDLRTALGCYGDDLAISPNIDRLAATGRLFTGAYTQQAVCGPSRASILTGRLPDETRVWHNRNKFRDTLPDIVTLPQAFMRQGYTALSLGKIISGNAKEKDDASWTTPAILQKPGWKNYYLPENQGYSGKGPSYERADVPDDGYTDGKLANLALQTLEELSQQEEPFFLAVGFFKPHLPFNAPKKYWDWYDPEAFTLEDEPKEVKDSPETAYHSHRELGGYVDMPQDEQLDAEQTRVLRHGYYACVSYVDTQVGKLLEKLEELGEADNTIVVLWGDHGFALGETQRWCKGTNFELDTRVPLIVRVPGMDKPGIPTDSLVELIDLYPTLADLAGLETPWQLDGTSFRQLLNNPRAPGRDIVRSQFARPFSKSEPEVMGYSIRTPTHRYGRWVDFSSREVIAEELYDYTDVSSVTSRGDYRIENANLVDEPASSRVLDELRAKMNEQQAFASAANEKPFLNKKVLFEEKTDGYSVYRIPGIVVTSKGTILAYCEARKLREADRGEIEIHMRRSTDGGETFSQAKQVAHMGPRLPRNPHMPESKRGKDMGGPDEQTVNNPMAIAGKDGLVHMVYCVEYVRAFYMVSKDDGLSWSDPVEITYAMDQFRGELDWQAIASGPGHAIQLANGRLMVPFWLATYEEIAPLRKATGVIFSDDNGKTWEAGDLAVRGGGEPNVAQLADGRVIMTVRNSHERNRRLASYSDDGATNWSEPHIVEDLLEPGCMAGIVAHPGGDGSLGPVLLFSNPHTTKRKHSARHDVTIKLSRDGGLTWPTQKLLEDGPSAYSDLAVLPDGTILCFYESGIDPPKVKRNRDWAYANITLARFNLEWLTQPNTAP